MKKILAILLLLLLVFNLYGYRLWFCYLQQQSQQQIAKIIDRDSYEDSELITLKVPLSLPYSTSWSDFERYDGNIEIDGQHYSYVKRKVCNDTLVLLCLPNTRQNKLTSNQKNFEKLYYNGYGQVNNKAGSPLLLVKLLTGEYDDSIACYQLTDLFVVLPKYTAFNNVLYYFYSITSPWQPPDFLS